MRKIVLLLVCVPALLLPARAQEPDSLALEKLDVMLARYTEAIEMEGVDVKSAECDFLISSVQDSIMTQHIALWLYDRYKESPRMGDEAVAIHIWDNWFKPGTISMRSDIERFDADLFATFNRSTLLGMKAPVLDMQGPCGRKMKVPQEGSYSILFFYDTGCAKCKITAQVLPSTLKKITFPARFYAVYCGHDKKEWRRFRKSFKVKNKHLGIVHAWDPEVASDYLRLYGVISTPKLYFADTDGEILGRRLEVESLDEIIHYICEYYGQAQEK